MQRFTAFQYLLIDLANAFGLDKQNYSVRLQWAKENLKLKDTLIDQADDKPGFIKTSIMIDETIKGNPIGGTVKFDAVCSGIQILSALTKCVPGAKATGLINTGKRPNAYMMVKTIMEEELGTDIEICISDIKQAVMTAAYGSTAEPKKLFDEVQLEAFHYACNKVAPNAFGLFDQLVATWNSEALHHSWYMPDGHHVHIPVVEKQKVRIEVDELAHYKMNTLIEVNTPREHSVSNIANIVHSIDAYIQRNLVRYCSIDYSNRIVALREYLLDRKMTSSEPKLTDEVDSLIHNIDYDWDKLSTTTLTSIYHDLLKQEQFGTFDILTVHDCFGCHPNNMQALRFWYNTILSRLSDSQILNSIVNQLGHEITLNHEESDKDFSKQLLEADYAIT